MNAQRSVRMPMVQIFSMRVLVHEPSVVVQMGMGTGRHCIVDMIVVSVVVCMKVIVVQFLVHVKMLVPLRGVKNDTDGYKHTTDDQAPT